jgi:hypothetical protein
MFLLPPRLLTPAKLLFDAANKAKVPAILFGGVTANLNGGLRETKDHFPDIRMNCGRSLYCTLFTCKRDVI